MDLSVWYIAHVVWGDIVYAFWVTHETCQECVRLIFHIKLEGKKHEIIFDFKKMNWFTFLFNV